MTACWFVFILSVQETFETLVNLCHSENFQHYGENILLMMNILSFSWKVKCLYLPDSQFLCLSVCDFGIDSISIDR